MAQMTQSQIDAELMRKIASGESKASSAANQARMDQLRAAQQQATGRASVYGAMAAQPDYKAPTVTGPGVPNATTPGDPAVTNRMLGFYAAGAGTGGGTGTGTTTKDPYAAYGGRDNYVTSQQGRYGAALNAGDMELVGRLEADAKRAGYTLVKPGSNKQEDKGAAIDTGAGAGGSAGGGPTPQTYIDGLTDAQRAATLAQFEKSKNQSLSNLQGERATIAPKYYDQRNAAAAGSQQQARNFAEFMAARGGTNSGANAQAELSRGMQLQGDLGTLGRQEAAAFTDIERRTTDVNNGYQSDIAGAEAGLQRDRMQLLLSDYYRAQDRGDRLKQQEIENEFARAGLTGMLNNNGTQTRTIQGQSLDRSILESDRNFKYQLGRDRTEDEKWMKTFQEDRKRYGEGFAYQKARDAIGDAQQKQQFDEDVRRFSLDYAINQAQLRISQQNANTSASNAAADNRRAETAAGRAAKSADEDRLFRIWETTGEAPAGIDGVTPGTKLFDAVAARQGDKPSSFKDDADFQSDLSNMLKDPIGGQKALRDNAQAFIDKYGMDGYTYLKSKVN